METMTAWNRNIPFFEREVLPLVRGQDIKILEIGSYQGASTRWILDNLATHPQSEVWCIDMWEENSQHQDADFKQVENSFDHAIAPHAHKVKKLKGDSWSQLVSLNNLPVPPEFDIVYLDGDHSAQAVLRDLVLVWPLLLEGGILICDDYVWKENIEAWRLGFRDYQSPLQTPKIAIDSFSLIYSDQIRHWISYNQYGTVAMMKISP